MNKEISNLGNKFKSAKTMLKKPYNISKSSKAIKIMIAINEDKPYV